MSELEPDMKNVIMGEIDDGEPDYDPVADLMHPAGKPCSFCNSEYDDEEWGSLGWIGILPISLCGTCFNGIFNMVYNLIDEDLLRQWLKDKTEEEDVENAEIVTQREPE